MNEQEMLVRACEKLGWVHVATHSDGTLRGLPSPVSSFHRPVPDLLHSFDAHFAPGSTVEWMRERGFYLQLSENEASGDWHALFVKSSEGRAIKSYGVYEKTPAMAILKAFLKYQ